MLLLFLPQRLISHLHKMQYVQSLLQREKKDVRLMNHTTEKWDNNLTKNPKQNKNLKTYSYWSKSQVWPHEDDHTDILKTLFHRCALECWRISQVNSVVPQGSLEAVAPEPSARHKPPWRGSCPPTQLMAPAAWSRETTSSNAGAW